LYCLSKFQAALASSREDRIESKYFGVFELEKC